MYISLVCIFHLGQSDRPCLQAISCSRKNEENEYFKTQGGGSLWSSWLAVDIAALGRCGDGSVFAFSSRRAWRRLVPLSNDTSIIDFPLIRLVAVSAASLSLALLLPVPLSARRLPASGRPDRAEKRSNRRAIVIFKRPLRIPAHRAREG